MVADPVLAPPLLEYLSHVEGGSSVSFDKDDVQYIGNDERAYDVSFHKDNSEDTPPISQSSADPSSCYAPIPPSTAHVPPPTAAPITNSTAHVPSHTAESSKIKSDTGRAESDLDSDVQSIDGGVEVGSDVNEYEDDEVRSLREEKRNMMRRKMGERQVIPKHVKLGIGRRGPDACCDESAGGDRNSLKGKLAGDEPFYPSYEAPSFETDSTDITNEEGEIEQVEHRVKARRRKKSMEHGSFEDQSKATFSLTDEEHTLANALRFTLNQDPRVTFCGYSIPHPSDARVNIRVQTTGDPAKEVLNDSFQDLMLICEHVRGTFDQAILKFKTGKGLASMDIKK